MPVPALSRTPAQFLAQRFDNRARGYTLMTVRVDTFETPVGSQSWFVPTLRSLSSTAVTRLLDWWLRRSSPMVMSDEWMHELRATNRQS